MNAQAKGLGAVRQEAIGCRRCHLWKVGTQTVFGEGPADARLVLVGEQPGDREDVEGQPFVGPAGEMLDRALVDAHVNRDTVYVTNAVKHFKFTQRGKRRLHQKPNAHEIERCRWWLDKELALLEPPVTVALGATAARAARAHRDDLENPRRSDRRRGRPLLHGHGASVLSSPHSRFAGQETGIRKVRPRSCRSARTGGCIVGLKASYP